MQYNTLLSKIKTSSTKKPLKCIMVSANQPPGTEPTHKRGAYMINGGSLFSQVLSLIDRALFQKEVKAHHTERSSKGSTSWSQFVSLMFSQFAGANSLREIAGGLATIRGKINHLGLSGAPNKSTLSYANAHQSRPILIQLRLPALSFKMRTVTKSNFNRRQTYPLHRP